ncbi:MAG: hypothetical protein GY915_00505, partial [bacterium]|nr:hypothetical protein [bacterium]
MPKKWKNLSDSFKKCLDREREATKSGSGYKKPSTCHYYKQLLFLRDVLMNRKTSSNISLSSPSTSSSDDQPNSLESSSFPSPQPPVSETLSASPSVASPSTVDLDDSQSQPPPSIEPQPETPSYTRKVAQPQNRPAGKKRKVVAEEEDPIQSFLVESIKKRQQEQAQTQKEQNDPDDLFCRSLVATLKRLPQKKNQMAKLKI